MNEPFPGSPDDMMNTIAELRARVAKLETALSGLVYRLDEIHEDPAFKSVWTVHQLHVGPYRGPTYVDALAAARAALKDAQAAEKGEKR